ncbi:unnamed protein product, partial [Prunus brigantina]
KTQDSLFSAPTKYVKSFENEEGRGKGKSKVTGTSRRNEKGKKDGEVQRGGWSFKGNSVRGIGDYGLASNILFKHALFIKTHEKMSPGAML